MDRPHCSPSKKMDGSLRFFEMNWTFNSATLQGPYLVLSTHKLIKALDNAYIYSPNSTIVEDFEILGRRQRLGEADFASQKGLLIWRYFVWKRNAIGLFQKTKGDKQHPVTKQIARMHDQEKFISPETNTNKYCLFVLQCCFYKKVALRKFKDMGSLKRVRKLTRPNNKPKQIGNSWPKLRTKFGIWSTI